MKTATVADLRNNFRRIAAMIENGESVDITRRGKVFARVTPPAPARGKLVKPDIMKRLKEVWGDRCFTAAEVKAIRDFGRQGEQG